MNQTIFPPSMSKIEGQTELLNFDIAIGLGEGKLLIQRC